MSQQVATQGLAMFHAVFSLAYPFHPLAVLEGPFLAIAALSRDWASSTHSSPTEFISSIMRRRSALITSSVLESLK